MILKLVVFTCAVVLSACTGVQVDTRNRHVRGFDLTASREASVAHDNLSRVRESYEEEWRYNRRDKSRPPQLCLAMSGGGMRSAAFNIGVLRGLYNAGLLSDVDVMSSVSGGGYALSWYFLQQATTGADEKELFAEDGRFQQYLINNSNLAYSDPDSPFRWLSYVEALGKWVPSWPAHVVANGLFEWHANLNPLRLTYENGIERVFHLSPVSTRPEVDGFVNKAWFGSSGTVAAEKKVTFPQLRDYIEKHRTPFFVINATVAIDDDPEHYGAEFSKTIYEFTPLKHGSDAFGARFTEFPFSVSRAVAVSGAAKDSATTPGAKRELLDSMTNTDLGYFFSNPSPRVNESHRTMKRILPFPLYPFMPNYKDQVGTDIYLTDGGHSDNLAVFSLVRRMCGEIIVVDAEHDPEFRLQGLMRLKRRLLSELGVSLDLPEPYNVYPGAQNASREQSVSSRPLVTGTIGSFPVQYNLAQRKARDITVRYLKLSIDEARLSQYSSTVRGYYERHGKDGDRDNRFPQQRTSDINYNPGQFLAYRDLGSDMVRIYLEPAMKSAIPRSVASAPH